MHLSHVPLVRAAVAFITLLSLCITSFCSKYPIKITENELKDFANDWRIFVKETMLKIQQQQQQQQPQQKVQSLEEGQLLPWSFFIDNLSRFIDPSWGKADREQVRDFYLMLGNGPINKSKENIRKFLNSNAIGSKSAYELILDVFFTWALDVYSHLGYIKEDLQRIKMTFERVNINLYAYRIVYLDLVGATDIGSAKVSELFGFLDSRIAAPDFTNLINAMIKLNQPTGQYTVARTEDPYLLKENLCTVMERIYGPRNRPSLLPNSSWGIIKNKGMDQYHEEFYKVLMSPLALKCELLKPSACLVLEYYRRGYQCIRPLDKNELIKLSTSWTQNTGNFIKLNDCDSFNNFLQFLGDQEIIRQSVIFNSFTSRKLWDQLEEKSSNNLPVSLPLFYLSTLKSLDSAYLLYGDQAKDWIEKVKVQTNNSCAKYDYAFVKKEVGLIILAHLNNPKHNVLGRLMACASGETLRLLPKLESYPLIYRHLIIPELEEAAVTLKDPNQGLLILFIINKLKRIPEKTFILIWNKIEKEKGYNIIDTVGYPLNLKRLVSILKGKFLNDKLIANVETLSSELFK